MAGREQPQGPEQPPAIDAPAQPRQRWDSLGVVIASLVGLLALLVSGYTAWIQRQQVRAEVWPRLVVGVDGNDRSIVAINKGVGPAIVRSPQVFVDGEPQRDWDQVLRALGLSAHGYDVSTINHNVLAPGEEVPMLHFVDIAQWNAFREVGDRVAMDICFCSTLDDCWLYSDRREPGGDIGATEQLVEAVEQCPSPPKSEIFVN